VQLLLVLPALTAGTALPIFARAARDDRARLAYALGRTFEVSFVLGVGVAIEVSVGAPMAVFIFGHQFQHSVVLLAIQATGLGASFVGAVWANGLLSLGRYRVILAINLFALVVGSALIVALVLADGVRGAAIASAVWEGVSVVLSGIALAKADRLLRPPLRIMPKVAIAAGLAALTTLVALPVLISVLVAGVVYLAAVYALRAIPKELLTELRRAGRAPA
jgi:O-antigen/teichoic acid export membrane protein